MNIMFFISVLIFQLMLCWFVCVCISKVHMNDISYAKCAS